MHSFLVARSTFINKKPSLAKHRYFIYRCQVNSFEVTNHKLNPAVKRSIFLPVPHMSFRKCTLITYNCVLLRCLLADTSVNHMVRSRGTLVPHLVRVSYSTTLLAIVHMSRDYYIFTLDCQRTKKAFRNSWRYFVFVYQRVHSYEERMHVPPEQKLQIRGAF